MFSSDDWSFDLSLCWKKEKVLGLLRVCIDMPRAVGEPSDDSNTRLEGTKWAEPSFHL